LSQFIKDNITSQELFTQNMLNGVWIEQAVELSQQPVHRHDSEKNGADEICDYLFENHLLKP